ncbi:MAG: REP-associated tyrosine transposase [Bacteroidota bacterium]
MSRKYKVFDISKPYFVTSSIVSWIKIFNDEKIISILIDSIIYCQLNKGLEIYAYVIMPDHSHMVCRSISDNSLSDIFRDLKKFTSRSIIKYLKQYKSRIYSSWLDRFRDNNNDSAEHYRIWQNGYNPKELSSNKFMDQKIEYIHSNPVKAGLVSRPNDYIYSSARNYSEKKGVIDVVVTYGRWETY